VASILTEPFCLCQFSAYPFIVGTFLGMTVYSLDYPYPSTTAGPLGKSKTCNPYPLKPLALSALTIYVAQRVGCYTGQTYDRQAIQPD